MAGETVTLIIACRVQPVALVNNEQGRLVNDTYVYSPYKVSQNTANPNGVSFADNNGNPVSTAVDEQIAAGELGLKASASVGIASAGGVTINKFVTVGGDTAGNDQNSVAETGEAIRYEVRVTNNGKEPITNLWISDTLPYAGDGRGSSWTPKS